MKEACETLREAFEELVREFSIEIFDDPAKTQAWIRDLLAEQDAERSKFELLMKAGGMTAMLDALALGAEEQRAALLTTAKRIQRGNMTSERDALEICESFARAIGCAVPEKAEGPRTPEGGGTTAARRRSAGPAARRPAAGTGAVIPPIAPVIPGMTFSDGPGGKVVERYDGSQSVVAIPDSVGGVPVVGIARFAFAQESTQRALFGVQIPPSVTVIGEGAFEGCAALEAAALPPSLEELGARAFACTGLREVRFPDGVTVIGACAFEGCTELKRVFYPEALERIGDRAFCGCTELESGRLPDGVTSIGRESFCGCESLTEISGASALRSLGYRAFAGCSALRSVKLPEAALAQAGKGLVFEGCERLPRLRPGLIRRAVARRETL